MPKTFKIVPKWRNFAKSGHNAATSPEKSHFLLAIARCLSTTPHPMNRTSFYVTLWPVTFWMIKYTLKLQITAISFNRRGLSRVWYGQCDWCLHYFSIFVHLQQRNIRAHWHLKFTKAVSKFCHRHTKYTLIILPKTSVILLKWRNFAKSGHTGSG